jgi:hypothetical protein
MPIAKFTSSLITGANRAGWVKVLVGAAEADQLKAEESKAASRPQ